jgi:hypothetical protein
VADQSVFVAFHLRNVVGGLILPALVSGCALALWRPRLSASRAGNVEGAAALALGGGFLAGYVVLLGWPSIPPVEAESWLAYLAAAAALIGVIGGRYQWFLGVGHLLLWPTGIWLLSRPLIANEWEQAEATRWLIGLSVGGLVYAAFLGFLARRRDGALALTLLIATGGTTVVLFWSRTAKLAQQAALLAAVLLPFCVWPFGRPRLALPVAAIPVVGILLPGLLLAGYFYAAQAPPVVSLGLILATPLGASLGLLPGPRWLRVGLSGAAALALVVLALVLASRAVEKEEDDLYFLSRDLRVSEQLFPSTSPLFAACSLPGSDALPPLRPTETSGQLARAVSPRPASG